MTTKPDPQKIDELTKSLENLLRSRRDMFKGAKAGKADNPVSGLNDGPPKSDELTEAALGTDENRRKVALAIIGVLAAGGLTLVPTKDAKAELFYSDLVGALNEVLGPMAETLLRAFAVGQGFVIPPSVMALIRMLLEWLSWTGETIITSDPQPPLERSWPREPPETADGYRELQMIRADASRQRVEQTFGILGSQAEQQLTMTLEEAKIIADAAASNNVITILNAQNALIGSVCARLGMISTAIGAHAQLTGHQAAQDASGVEYGAIISSRFIGDPNGPVLGDSPVGGVFNTLTPEE